ncbi:MAG: hypothetical protein J0L99_20920, partial [Chitinophagales bacterium]|nr:hypothetical protein [Chitinophagales bacterium]
RAAKIRAVFLHHQILCKIFLKFFFKAKTPNNLKRNLLSNPATLNKRSFLISPLAQSGRKGKALFYISNSMVNFF